MFPKGLQKYVASQTPVSAGDLNNIIKRLERLENLTAHPPLSVVNSGNGVDLVLEQFIPGVIRFQLDNNLDYYGSANARLLRYIPEMDDFEIVEDPVTGTIKVRDTCGVWCGEGNNDGRDGDRGYALGLGTGAGYEVISLSTRAKVIYFELLDPLTSTQPFGFGFVKGTPANVEYPGYIWGRDPAHENLQTSSSSSSSSSEEHRLVLWNPKTFAVSYMFRGIAGHRGWAAWDEYARQYWIFQMECP